MLSRQCGLTLVETMVGLTIGMLLVAGLALMFGNVSRSNSELEKTVRQIENGRYAIELLTQEISIAGFYGSVPSRTAAAVSAVCATAATLAGELQAMQALVTPAVPFPVEGVTSDTAAGLACLQDHKPTTPVLVVRRLETATTPAAAVASFTGQLSANELYVQTSHNLYDNYFSYKAALGSSPATLNLRVSGPSTALLNPPRRFVTRIYYVASCNECGSDTVPTLKVAELTGNSFSISPLVEGIEQIAFDFGIDTDNNGGIDEWYGINGTASAVTEGAAMATKGWGNVMAVRLHLLARNVDPTAGWNDITGYRLGLRGTAEVTHTPSGAETGYKRRAYTSTIRLNSWAGLRET